jgi:hypothetical protein
VTVVVHNRTQVAVSSSAKAAKAAPKEPKVTKTAAKPGTAKGLGNLTNDELKKICQAHGLTKSGNKEDLLARLKNGIQTDVKGRNNLPRCPFLQLQLQICVL